MSRLSGDIKKVPNPFRPVVPDNAEPDVILGLFESVDTFDSLREKGHHIVVGPRGSGKSIILRRLSASVKSKADNLLGPDYFGVYVLIRNSHAEIFRRSFRDTGDSHLFQHFLTCYILSQVVAEIDSHNVGPSVASAVSNIISKSCPCVDSFPAGSATLVGVRAALDEQWKEASRIADGIGQPRSDYIQSSRIPDIMIELAGVLTRATGRREGIGLLIDSYGYLKELAGFINSWMRKDLVDYLSIKASGITNHEAINSPLVESRPEPNHDFSLVPHQFNPVSSECLDVFRAIANKRLKREGFSVLMEELLPASIDIPDKTKLFWVQPSPTPIEYLTGLSGGDVGAFIHTLELIWGCVKRNAGRFPISPEDFGIACRRASDTYWRETIPVQARDEWRELQSLTRAAATKASEQSRSCLTPEGVVVGFMVQDSDEMKPQLKKIIQSGLRLGILQCNPDDRTAMEIDSDYCPGKFELNRRLCAHGNFSLDPRGCTHAPVRAEEILKWVQTPYHGQDDKPTGGGVGRSQFSWANCVFLSCPLPSETCERPEPQSRLLQSLFRVLKAAAQGSGRLSEEPERKDLVRDPLDLKLDDFIKEIPEAIRHCRFIVHDVTELSPGVAFELGLALAYGKVRALVWDEARRPFQAAQLPALIATRVNVNHFAFKGDRGFNSWLDDTIVRPCLQRLSDTPGPIPERQRGTLFTYIGERYADLKQALSIHMASLHEPKLPDDGTKENRQFHRLEALIRSANAALINYDDKDLLSAVLLGIAAGTDTPTIMTFDSSSSRQLTMWGDRPLIDWRPRTVANDLSIAEFPSQLRQLLAKGSSGKH